MASSTVNDTPYWPSAVELRSSHPDPTTEPGPMQETYFERLWRTRAKGANGPVTVHEPSVPAHSQSNNGPLSQGQGPRDQGASAYPDPSGSTSDASSQIKQEGNWQMNWSGQGQGPFPRVNQETRPVYPFASADTSNRFSQLLKAKLAAEQPRETQAQPSAYPGPLPSRPQPPYPGHHPFAAGSYSPSGVPPSPWTSNYPPSPHPPQMEVHPPQNYSTWGPASHSQIQSHITSIPQNSDSHNVELNPLQPVPIPWQQPLSNSPFAQMAQAQQSSVEQKAHPDQGLPPYTSWGSTSQLDWASTGSYGPLWQAGPDGRPVPSQTPTLTHRSCDSVDSIEPPVTPLISVNRLPQVESAYPMKPQGGHPPMIMASDMPSNGDMGSYIGVGQNPNGSAPNSNGNGELPSGFGDSGDGSGDGGAGGSGDDGQDDQNGAPPTGSGRKRIKLPLACHFCRRRKLKCNGKRPECDHCAKRGETCIYDEHVRRRGPGKRTKEMRDKAAREAEEAGMTNPNSASNIAGPSTLDPADFGINDQNLNVDGIELHGHEYEGDGAVMDAMDAVMGAGIQLDMADEGAIHMARVGIEGIEGLADHNDYTFPEPSTLAELGAIDPSLRGLGDGRHLGTGTGNGEEMKGTKRKLEEGYEERQAKMERQG